MTRPDYYGNPGQVTAEVDVVRAIYAAFARRDLDAALTWIAEDCELHADGTARAAGRDGPYRGHEGVRLYFADVATVWDEMVLHADDIRVLPGHVIVIGHVSARRGESAMKRSVVWTWRVRDGKAISLRALDQGELATLG